MGYGRTDAADGRVFPYVFTLPMTYWSAGVRAGRIHRPQEGGLDKLKGKKIGPGLSRLRLRQGADPGPAELAEKLGYELR